MPRPSDETREDLPPRFPGRTWDRRRFIGRLLALIVLGWTGAARPAFAQAQTQTTPPPELPSGVIRLPQTAPPTGMQTPLPPPVSSIARPEKPLLTSPTLQALAERFQNQPLTIQDAVALALTVNRSLALAGQALLRAQGRTEEAKTAFNPTLAASLSYTRLNTSQEVTFGGQTIPLIRDSQRQIGVQATLPIDISGLLRAATDQARFQEVALRLDINRARNQIVADVKSAFYDALRAQDLVRVATENLQNSLDRYSDAEKKLRAGTVARFDVIRAETDVANAQQQLIQARTNVSLAIASLNNAIGINIDTPLQITDREAVETPPGVAPPSIPPPPNAPLPRQAPDTAENTAQNPSGIETRQPVRFDPLNLGPEYAAALQEALKTRPEILQSDAGIAAAKKGIQLAYRSMLPSFGLTWGLNYAPDAVGFAPQVTTWQAVATISLPLFEGGVTRARVRQARADVAEAETNRRQAEDGVTLEVRQAYLNLVQFRNRIAVANQALAQAREAFRLARVRYNAGVSSQAGISPLLEVSDAQNALVLAENNQVNALYDYNNARARLDRAIGRYAFVNNGPGYSAPPAPKVLGNPTRSDNKR